MASGRGVFKINGGTHYLWRAMDHEDEVLENYVAKRHNRKKKFNFFGNLVNRYGSQKVILTDRLRSYAQQ